MLHFLFEAMTPASTKKPSWLKVPLPGGEEYAKVLAVVKGHKLHTVCQSALCPNQGECWNSGTATFMILGGVCTRNCAFCAVDHGVPASVDMEEPARVAKAAKLMSLKYVVLTSVTRDDLEDGGAGVWTGTIREVRGECEGAKIEALVPDFDGNPLAWQMVFASRPDVLNHNLETVPSLSRKIRPQASWDRSLGLLKAAAEAGLATKSGIMAGLGESEEELSAALQALRQAGVRFLTLGQYLQPGPGQAKVERMVPPEEFARWKEKALAMGFEHVEAGPLVRSSYHADKAKI
jgi:lipoyl synthase